MPEPDAIEGMTEPDGMDGMDIMEPDGIDGMDIMEPVGFIGMLGATGVVVGAARVVQEV